MRILDLLILIIATVCVATPVQAQTYDPSYPVCMKVYSSDCPTTLLASSTVAALGDQFGDWGPLRK